MPWRYAAALLNESHLVDFLHAGDTRANFCQTALAQSDHALFARDALNLRSRAAVHDHLANAVGQIKQFANRRSPVIPGAGAFQAAGTLGKRDVSPYHRIEARFFQLFQRIPLGLLAVRANHADQTLRHDAVQSGDEVVRFDAHVDETADDVRDVVGVDGGENQVAGERRLDSDLRGFLVADFANHDLVRVVAKDGAQAARKGQALFFVYGNLSNAAKLVFDGIFNGDNFVLVGFNLVDGRI